MTQAWEAGTTSGRGRRVGHSFGSPTGRALRDGKEGLRGDGRPPVGTLPRIVRPSVEVPLRPPQLSLRRPATGFNARGESKSSGNGTNPLNGLEPICKPRSVENLAQPERVENEISQARRQAIRAQQSSQGIPVPHLQGGEKLDRARIDMTQSQIWIVSIARISSMGLITSLLVPLRESLPRPVKCAMNLPIT